MEDSLDRWVAVGTERAVAGTQLADKFLDTCWDHQLVHTEEAPTW